MVVNAKLKVATLLLAGLMGTACTVKVTSHGEAKAGKPLDADMDGIADADDKCPKEKEDGLAPAAKDGCPNLDPDGDKILADADKCPNEPETMNKFKDEDGCPDKIPTLQLPKQSKLAKITATKVEISEKVQFGLNSADILPASTALLDDVAKVLKQNPDVQVIEVGGHASESGDANYNVSLTQRRVDSVVAELVKRGVAKERLVSTGYGFYCPSTAATSAKDNRRVEFTILHRQGKPLDAGRGCDKAAKAGVKIVPPPAPVWNPAKQ